MTSQTANYKKAFIILTSLFFMWGLITVLVDSLIPRLKEVFEINGFTAGLVQSAFFIAYFLVSIPAGALLNKIGYKRGIMLGLGIMGIGCLIFFPAASERIFALFLMAMFVLASGITILQVAANPYVTVLGDEKTASSRLNLSQAFNSLGTTIAPMIGAIFILSDNIKTGDEIKLLSEGEKATYFASEASAVQAPFLVLAGALILLGIIVWLVKFPNVMGINVQSYSKAFKKPRVKLGAIGIFVYVGAEVALSTYGALYFVDMGLVEVIKENSFLRSIASFFLGNDLYQVDGKGIAGTFMFIYWGGAMLGRFVGSILMTKIKPNILLAIFATGAIVLLIISASTQGLAAMFALLAVGLCNSIMFPTIFSLGIEGLGELKPQGSGILCTAIVGGGVIPPLYGYFSDSFGFKLALILVIVCYAYIFFYARRVNLLNE